MGTVGFREPVPPMVSLWTRGWGIMDEGTSSAPPSSSGVTNSSQGLWFPIYVPTTCIAKQMWWANGSSVAAGYYLEVGIYRDGGHKPGARLCTTDVVVVGTANQVQSANLIEAVAKNPYNCGTTTYALLGDGGTSEQLAQTFTVPSDCTVRYLRIALAKEVSPTDNFVATIESSLEGGGTTASVAGADLISGSAKMHTLDFGESGVALTASTTYYLRFSRSGSRDASNYFRVYSTGDLYSGQAKRKASGSWSDLTSVDLNFYLMTASGASLAPILSPGLYWLYLSSSTNLTTFQRSIASASWDELLAFEQSSINPGSAPDPATPVERTNNGIPVFGFSTKVT